MLVDKTILKFINTGMAVQNIFQELSWVRVNSKELRIDKFQTCHHYYDQSTLLITKDYDVLKIQKI